MLVPRCWPSDQELLSRATKHKITGNSHYTSKPPQYEQAIASYKLAIDHLPTFPSDPTDPEHQEQDSKNDFKGKMKVEEPVPSGLQEVTEEEAVAIQKEENTKKGKSPEELEREEVEDEIKECTKACWGNLAACYIAIVRLFISTSSFSRILLTVIIKLAERRRKCS